MKKHPILFGILILLAAVYISNSFFLPDSNIGTPGKQSSRKPAAGSKVSVDQIVDMIDGSCRQVFGNDYDIETDKENNIVRVNIWRENIDAQMIERTKSIGDISVWNNMVSDLKETASVMQKSFVELGHDEITVVLNVCDYFHRDIAYLSIANGVAGYDAVNEIDLLNKNAA